MSHLTVEIDYDEDNNEDVGAVARAFADINIEQEGASRVKVYAEGELIAERFSEDSEAEHAH